MRKDWVRVSVLLGYNRPKLWWHPRFAISIINFFISMLRYKHSIILFDSGMAFLTLIVNSATI